MPGWVDFLDSNQVTGWAVKPDGKTPDTVKIAVDGTVIAEIRPSLFRPDVRASGLGDGWSGFRYYFPEPIGVLKRSEVVIRTGSDEVLGHIVNGEVAWSVSVSAG